MSATIESLEVEIQSSSTSAAKGIDVLASSLDRLKNALKGGAGLNTFSKQLGTLNTALGSVSDTNARTLDRLTRSLQNLSSVGNLKISPTIASQLANIGNAVRSLAGANFGALTSLVNALRPLSTLGKVNLNSFISQLTRLPQAVAALGSTNFGNFSSQITQLVAALAPLSSMGKNNLTSFITQLSKLPALITSLKSVNMGELAAQIRALANAFAPLANQMQKISAGFAAFPARIQRLITSTNSLSGANNRASTSYINLAAKISIAMVAMRAVVNVIGSWITKSNKYIEDLNLFNASMGEYAKQAQEYAEKVSEVMGIDPGEWMRNQGIFMTLATGFGVLSDRAYIMSKNLTQLGYDLSSFFNISFEDAMAKLQSGLAGELEPLRRLGYDLSVVRLQQEAYTLGINKRVSAMTQAEKSELRYYAIMTQVTTAQGDMARTLAAPSNQLRILQAQVGMAARALGNIFIPVLNAVLPYAIALAQAIRLLADSIASLFGFKLPEVDYSGIGAAVGGIADGVDDIGSGLGNAAKKAKEVKNALLGIDELNIISPLEEPDGAGGGGGGGAGGGSGGLGFDLPEYDFLGDALNNKIQGILDKLKEWLGLNKEIASWADFMDTRLFDILTLVAAITGALAGWKILSLLKGFGVPIGLKHMLGITLAIGGAIEYILQYWNAWVNGVDFENFIGLLAGTAAVVGGLAIAFGTIGAAIGAIVTGLPMFILGIKDAVENGLNLLNGVLIPLGSTLTGAGIGALIGALGGPIGAGIGALIGLAVGLLVDFGIWLYQHWDEVSAYFEGVLDEVSAYFEGVLDDISSYFEKTWNGIVAFVKDVPNKIIRTFDALDAWVKNLPGKVKAKLDAIGKYLDELPGKIKKWFSDLAGKISKWFSDLWQPIKDFDWGNLGYNIGQWFGSAVKKAYDFVTKTVPQWFKETGNAIKEGFKTFFTSTLPTFFKETLPQIVQSVADFFKTLPERIGNIVKSTWNGIVEVGTSIIDGIVEGFKTVGTAIKNFVKGFVQGFKDALGIHSPSTVFAEIGVNLIEGLFNGLRSIGNAISEWFNTKIVTPVRNLFSNLITKVTEFFSNAWTSIKNTWSAVTNWFNVNIIRPVRDLFSTLHTNIKDFFSAAWTFVKNVWTVVTNWFNVNVIQPVRNLFSTLRTNIQNFFSEAWNFVKNIWTAVSNWFNVNVITPVKNLFSTLRTNIKDFFSDAWNGVKNTWAVVTNWFNTNIVQPVYNLFSNLRTNIKNFFSDAWTGIKNTWSAVTNWFTVNVTNPVQTAFSNVTTNVSGYFTSLWNGIKSTFEGVANWFKTTVADPISSFFTSAINSVIRGLNAATGAINRLSITAPSWVPEIGGKTWGFNLPTIPYLAKGGIVNAGQLFVARENGLPEMVGAFGNKTGVMNNTQIVEAVSSGVFHAVRAAMSGLRVNLALDTSAMKFGSASLAETYAPSVSAKNNHSVDGNGSLKDAVLQALVESGLVDDMRRQADKDESPIVQIGNRVITDAVTTQKKANGYQFVTG